MGRMVKIGLGRVMIESRWKRWEKIREEIEKGEGKEKN